MNKLTPFVIASALASCSAESAPRFEVTVRVESDPGVPLPDARARREGESWLRSDARGVILVTLEGQPGDKIPIEVVCPDGYRSPTTALQVLLRNLDESSRRPEFLVSCPPNLRRVVVAVRATRGPDIPVRYLGQAIARTDADGVAHALLTAAPGDTLALTLDTSEEGHTQLMPQQPELKVSVPDRDSLVIFDQVFSQPAPVKVKPKFRPQSGPQRI